MNPASKGEQWFALFVRTRWEQSTESLLRGKGFETFLATHEGRQKRNGRLKKAALPLFPGYVFCRFDVQKRLPILVTPGVISVVGSGKIPIPLDDSEITAIQMVVQSGLPVQPCPYLEVGQRVRIRDMALAGVEGVLCNFRGADRVVVSVSLLRRSVALEIDRSRVVPVRAERAFGSRALSSRPLLGESVA
jgi:transcription antitermination factor NusG